MKTENLTFRRLRQIVTVCEDLGVNTREVVENIENEDENFEVDNYRFISKSSIDKIQQDELSSDPYILGCFNDWFLADNTDLSLDIIKALQAADKYEAIGQHIIDNDLIETIQSEYASADGYGHHFAAYDGNTIEDLLNLDSETGYYIFRVN